MSLFKRLLNIGKKEQESTPDNSQANKFLPEDKPPIDEEFTINFKKNGGKFLYCENKNEIFDAFDNILVENDWYETEVYCLDKHLIQTFDGFNLKFQIHRDTASFMLTTCESLVADKGSILLSSNQLKGRKLWELPTNLVLFATTSQIVGNISDGMQIINQQSKKSIPVDITTIRHFGDNNNDDFMIYGNSNKNLYLLLMEDL